MRPVVPDSVGSNRRQAKSASMQDYVRGMQQRGTREIPYGGRGSGPVRGKCKLMRPNTVVSELGKKLRVFETDASESGEDVSFHAPAPQDMKLQ